MNEEPVRGRLFAAQDVGYKAFQCKLMPTVDPETVIGVRIPAIRKLAKELAGEPEAGTFLKSLPHRYYDENNLHGCLISLMRNYQEAAAALDIFLPYVDNWATCDLISPKAFKTHPPELPRQAQRWMDAGHPFAVRFGIGVLLKFYLDGAFQPEYLEWVALLRSEEYYVNMMAAWYFATALAKQYEAAVPYLELERLDLWIHNKAIQKAVESCRVTKEQKVYLRTLKRKIPKG